MTGCILQKLWKNCVPHFMFIAHKVGGAQHGVLLSGTFKEMRFIESLLFLSRFKNEGKKHKRTSDCPKV